MSGRRVLVTGGSIGIGAACVRHFAAAGDTVVIGDVLDDEGSALAAELTAAGGEAAYVRMDMRSGEQIRGGVSDLEGDGFDLVVANAGIARRHPFVEMNDEQWDETLAVNLTGASQTFRAALPRMVARGSGSLVAVSSVMGTSYGWERHAHYTVSKAGLVGLVRALAVELGPAGIRVNAVAPGFIRTAQALDPVNSAGAEALEASAVHVPAGRIGEPVDVADVVGFLASDAARYVSGQVVTVDGGLVVQQP